jgi:hypothetical protein
MAVGAYVHANASNPLFSKIQWTSGLYEKLTLRPIEDSRKTMLVSNSVLGDWEEEEVSRWARV